MPIDPARAKQLFLASLDLPPDGRAAFLDRECGPDAALRARLDELLAHHVSALPDNSTGSYPNATRTAGDGTRSAPTAPEVAGTVIAGRYKLLQQIGEGGMGTVWMADQTEPVKRRVAVKLIRAEKGNSKTILSRFEAERQAIALMDHPHIAKLLDAGTWSPSPLAGEGLGVRGFESPFFVMELVKGVPLTDYCDAHRLSIPDRLALFTQICSAVQHAHQKGVIHRDLKPTNILVESHDGKPVPKVIDFGLAKATSGLQLTENTLFTGFGSVMGTPTYMAPEQATFNAVDIDTRADIYALGVILYELLTGTTPLTRDGIKKAALDEMLRLVREQEAPTPSSRLSSSETKPTVAANRQTEPAKLGRFVKGELDWIVLKALSKDRDRRYETANGFARDVERFLNHEPVVAGPPTAGYRLRKFILRNRGPVLAGSLVLVALLLGIAGTTFGLLEAKRQEGFARDEATAKEQARAQEALQRHAAEAEKKRAVEAEMTAKENEAKAVGERKVSDALVYFFVNDILRQADARTQAADRSREVNPNLTVREALDRATERIGPRFRDQPLVEMSVREAIAQGYLGVGEAEKAIRHLERCRTVLTARLGADHRETLIARRLLVEAYSAAGRAKDAQALGEETLPRTRTRFGVSHQETLLLLNSLGGVYTDLNAPEKAVAVYEELRRVGLAEPDPQAEFDLSTMNNLAVAYDHAGRGEDARRLYEECLKRRRAEVGPDHPDTLMSMNNLGSFYWRAGRLDRSIPLFEEAIRLRRLKLGADHPYSIRTLSNLGINYRDAGRLPEAITTLEEAVRLGRQRHGPDVVLHFHTVNALAEVYTDMSEHRKAEPLFRWLLDTAGRQAGPQSTAAASWSARLGLNLLVQKRYDEAEELIRASLAVRERKEPDDWTTFNTRSILGGVLLCQGKSAEAEPLLLAGYQGMKQREVRIPKDAIVRLTESLDRLVELYTATNKPDEAKRYRELRAKYPMPKEVAPLPREKK